MAIVAKERSFVTGDNITGRKEKRTTLMIQNIPNKYSPDASGRANDKHCYCYDFYTYPSIFVTNATWATHLSI